MAPTIVEHPDGSFYLAIGGSGGSRIFASMFQVMLNLDWGMDVSESVEFGRVHDQLYPALVDVDNTYPKPLVDALRRRGHNITGLSPIVLLARLAVSVDNERSFGRQPRGRGCSGSPKGQ